MSELSDLLKSLPIDQIAQTLGVSDSEAKQAVKEGSAVILGGMDRNAQTPEGAAALEKALAKHEGTEEFSLDALDVEDGQKILGHVFGGQETEVVAALGAAPQTSGINFGKLLPIIAPAVMAFLAGKAMGGGSAQPKAQQSQAGGLDLGGILGGILGGSGARGGSSGGLDLGGILGGILGGR